MKTIDERIAKLQWRIDRQHLIIEKHQNEIRSNFKRLEKYRMELKALEALRNTGMDNCPPQG